MTVRFMLLVWGMLMLAAAPVAAFDLNGAVREARVRDFTPPPGETPAAKTPAPVTQPEAEPEPARATDSGKPFWGRNTPSEEAESEADTLPPPRPGMVADGSRDDLVDGMGRLFELEYRDPELRERRLEDAFPPAPVYEEPFFEYEPDTASETPVLTAQQVREVLEMLTETLGDALYSRSQPIDDSDGRVEFVSLDPTWDTIPSYYVRSRYPRHYDAWGPARSHRTSRGSGLSAQVSGDWGWARFNVGERRHDDYRWYRYGHPSEDRYSRTWDDASPLRAYHMRRIYPYPVDGLSHRYYIVTDPSSRHDKRRCTRSGCSHRDCSRRDSDDEDRKRRRSSSDRHDRRRSNRDESDEPAATYAADRRRVTLTNDRRIRVFSRDGSSFTTRAPKYYFPGRRTEDVVNGSPSAPEVSPSTRHEQNMDRLRSVVDRMKDR